MRQSPIITNHIAKLNGQQSMQKETWIDFFLRQKRHTYTRLVLASISFIYFVWFFFGIKWLACKSFVYSIVVENILFLPARTKINCLWMLINLFALKSFQILSAINVCAKQIVYQMVCGKFIHLTMPETPCERVTHKNFLYTRKGEKDTHSAIDNLLISYKEKRIEFEIHFGAFLVTSRCVCVSMCLLREMLIKIDHLFFALREHVVSLALSLSV